MNEEQRKELDSYYVDASSWADDLFLARAKQARMAWIIAGVAAFIAIAEAIAIVALTPLKTVVPYTFLVDKQTGYVQALKPLEGDTITPDEALTQSFLVQYVIAREGFDYSTVKTDYQKVAGWTGGAARNAYIAAMQSSSPESPFTLYPKGATVSVQVKSVSPLTKGTAVVRFDTIPKDAIGRIGPSQPWIATISYRYTGASVSVAERYINPLGFSVTRYRRDPEALPAMVPVAPVEKPNPALSDNLGPGRTHWAMKFALRLALAFVAVAVPLQGLSAVELPAEKVQIGYRLKGDKTVFPDEISDDGERTYIYWAADRELPAVFAVDEQKQEVLIDGYMRGDFYTIDRVYGQLVFRLGEDTATATRNLIGARK